MKGPIARELIATRSFGTSAQVLQEFYVNAVQRAKAAISPEEGLAWIDRLMLMPCVESDVRLIKSAITLSERYRIAYWDAAILAAAERLEAGIVYTEDLNHGQTYGAVRVVNPFLPA